jgi:hypothetical protein
VDKIRTPPLWPATLPRPGPAISSAVSIAYPDSAAQTLIKATGESCSWETGMSASDIQIVGVRLTQIPYNRVISGSLQPRLFVNRLGKENPNYAREMREWEREQSRRASERNVSASIQVKNAGSVFHTVSLLAYRAERGVNVASHQIDFGPIPPHQVSEQSFHMGGSPDWVIGGMVVDFQSYPTTYRLNGRVSGRSLFSRLFE